MEFGDYVSVGVRLVAVLSLGSCVVYPTERTYYEPNPDDGNYPSACGYMTTHNVIERSIDGVDVRIIVGGYDEEPSKRPETLDVYIRVHYQGEGVAIDPTKVSISAEGSATELRGSLLHPPESQVGHGYQKQAGRVSQTITLNIRYPAPAGLFDALSVKFDSGALQLKGEAQDVRPFRFRRVKKHDVYYGSINC
jgi:hypothetical protein